MPTIRALFALPIAAFLAVGCNSAGAPDAGPLPTPAPATTPGLPQSPDAGAGFLDAGIEDSDAGFLESDGGSSVGEDGGSNVQGPFGFIGSPCDTDADCTYGGAVCLLDGFVGGTCSIACDRFCDDQDGHPTTFCVDTAQLSGDAVDLGAGACLSHCDYGFFSDNGGCREGYGCREVPRANEPQTTRYACLPGESPPPVDCYQELAALGVDFEPTVIADQPTGNGLTCHVEDPVVLHPPIGGVDFVYYDGTPTPNIRGSCQLALALLQTADDVSALGVTTIRHIGTYNCRTIAGTNTLSRHAYGDAIDFFGFEFSDGRYYTLVDDWEHDTTAFTTDAAAWLYNTGERWFDSYIWNIVLTPNYNSAHDNHFHVDLTPGSHFTGLIEGRYFGPAPYDD